MPSIRGAERGPPDVMRQAVIAAPTRFDVVTARLPRLQSDGEILLQTALCGICSGDLLPWYLAKKVGTVLGHEVVGYAHSVGAAVTHVRPGDLVFVHHHAPCLDCEACGRGDFVHCATWRASRLDPGGMAEWIRVPEVNVRHDTFAVNDLTAEQAVFLEPLGCCVKALRQLVPGGPLALGHLKRGAIVGCGVMGLLNLALARSLGVQHLFAVEPDAERRRFATDLGAEAALTPEEARTTLTQTVDFVVIGPGQPEVIQQSLRYVRPGGAAVLFTPTPTGVMTSLDLGELYFREVRLLPSYSCGPDDTRFAYDLVRRRLVQPERLITHRFPLAEVQRAFDTALAGGATLKVLVELWGTF